MSQCGDAAIVSLPLNVIPKLLFETRSRRIEWSDPVGLFGLRFGDHVEPVGKKSILSKVKDDESKNQPLR